MMSRSKVFPPESVSRKLAADIYRALLRREPDDAGLDLYTREIGAGGFEDVLKRFLASDEFARLTRPAAAPAFARMNFEKPMRVETAVPPAVLDRLWSHVAGVWQKLGETEAYWSVLSWDDYKDRQELSPEAKQDFHASGRVDLDYFKSYMARADLPLSRFESALEYGCGLGRTTQWLAPEFRKLRAVDISRPHLHAARSHLDGRCHNIDWQLLTSKRDLGLLRGVDLFFSQIVLQHNPPPIILDILRHAFNGLNPRGVAFFQVPIYADGYSFSLADYWDDVAQRKSMEMHYVPQRDILTLADDCGMRVLEIRNDHCIGMFDEAISSTFLLQKRG